jgi:ADP-heptose:LPS heptosyltransferase
MHIASLTGIPVVSIWGGTHPDIGFSALYQPKENHIQIPVEVLSCRPCSVFGTAHCTHAKPFACMQDLQVDDVIKRLNEIGF